MACELQSSVRKIRRLHEAIPKCSIEEFEALLGGFSSEEINTDIKGQTALHRALTRVQFESGVQMLLDRGANVNVKNSIGETPLHCAGRFRNDHSFVALLEKEVDVNAQDKKGLTPLHIVAAMSFRSGVKLLLEKGASVNIPDFDGNTPLYFALRNYNMEIVEQLLSKGANVNHKNTLGRTPLHDAGKYSACGSVVRLLLEKGAEVNDKDVNGRTPMHLAVVGRFTYTYGPNPTVGELLDWGGSLYMEDNNGETPLDMVSNRYWVVHELKRHVIKLKTINFQLSNLNLLNDCDFQDLDYFQVQCLEEVEAMKIFKFGRNSLYDVFAKYDDPTYLANEEIEKAMMSSQIKLEFPIYSLLLRLTFEKAKERRVLLDKTQQCLTYVLPVEIVRKVLSYVDNKDLRNVEKASKTDLSV